MPFDEFLKKTDREIELEKKARRILNVGRDAGVQEVRKAFWRLSMQYHPDKNPGDEEAREHFLALVAAYEYLIKNGTADDVARFDDVEKPEDFEKDPGKYLSWWRGRFY